MASIECESQNIDEEQLMALSSSLTDTVSASHGEDVVSGGEEDVDQKESRLEKQQELGNPVCGIDIEGEDGDSISPCATVVPSNTPVTGDSGHVSPTMEISSDSLSDCTLQPQGPPENHTADDVVEFVETKAAAALAPAAAAQAGPGNTSTVSKVEVSSTQNSDTVKPGKHEKREEKKKSKKKEDKSVDHILRALNSLQSPEEKLAALCKKFADLHEEHRVLQTSFKTQQRTLTAVVREKDQLQSEHTKAMMAKSKLESLCRELQKHNKVIESESIKRAKESDEKRKEISAHFSNTISEIQNQMSDNSEKNNLLRKENENLAEQLRVFMSQCQARDEHVKKLQEQHDLENKLAAAKLAQADAIIRDLEERGNKEKELMLLKLTEVTKKSQLTESQLELYKSKYDEFSSLHTRSSETFQRYKTDMDKMTKRIKRLEKDGLQWKAKWESTSKTLVDMYEAKTKSDQEAAVSGQKVKKLESLCRALQAELHKKKVDSGNANGEEIEQSDSLTNGASTSTSAAPPNSPEVPSPDECAPASVDSLNECAPASVDSLNESPPASVESPDECPPASVDSLNECPPASVESLNESPPASVELLDECPPASVESLDECAPTSDESPSDPSTVDTPTAASPPSSRLSSCSTPDPSLVPDAASVTDAVAAPSQNCSEIDHHITPDNLTDDKTTEDVTAPVSLSSPSADEVEKQPIDVADL